MALSQDPEPELDWTALRAEAQRRLRARLRGWSVEAIEDATQEVMTRLLAFVRRCGAPRNPPGLLSVMCRRVAVDVIRRASIDRRHDSIDAGDLRLVDPDAAVDRELMAEEVRWAVHVVLAFFEQRKAPCLEIARARYDGLDLGKLAEATGQTHDELRQRWVRCARLLREAVERGEISFVLPRRGR